MEFNVEVKPTESAHHISVSKKRVAIIDSNTNIEFLDPKDLSKSLNQKQILNSLVTYKLTRGNTSSSDGRLMCLYLDTKKRTYLCEYDDITKQYKPRVNLEWSLGATEVSIFNKDNTLLLVGGADGRLNIYSAKGKLVNALPKMAEYVTAIAISSDSKLVAYASFKKKLIIFDLSKNLPLKVTSYNEIISIVGFLNKTKFLIYGARDNVIVLFDILNGRTVKELGNTINWPHYIYIDEHDQYALITDKAGYVHILDLTSTDSELAPFFNSPQIVVEIKALGDEFLYFLFEDGSLKVINILEAKKKIMEDAHGGSIAEVYKAISENPILKFGVEQVLAKTDEAYEKRLDLAMEEIVKDNIDTAERIMGKTLDSPYNKDRFETMLQHKDKLIVFWQYVTSAQYPAAYDLAQNSDFYKNLPFYEKMEERYTDTFNRALEIMLTTKNLKEANEELVSFLKVLSKQKGIKAMLSDPEKFAMVDKKFKDKKYDHVNKLVAQFPELKQAPFYHKYKNIMDDILKDFLSAMGKGNYSRAIVNKNTIEANFPDAVETLKEDFEKLDIVSKFITAVKEKKFGTAMDLAAENTYLIAADEYKILDDTVGHRIDLALKYAFSKKFQDMDKTLKVFLKSKYSRNRAIGIYKIFYLQQIGDTAKQMKQKHWKHTLKSYILRFGKDPEIESLVMRYDQDKVYKLYKDLDGNTFLKYKAVPNIVTGQIVPTGIKGA